jgi:hypothetical protein
MASTAVAVSVGLGNHANHTLAAKGAGPLATQLLAAWQKS